MVQSKRIRRYKIILIVLFLSVIGVIIYGYVKDFNISQASKVTSKQDSALTKSKTTVEAMEDELKGNPEDFNLRLKLANEYYDLGSVVKKLNEEEANTYFNKSVSHYQEYLKNKNDVSVWVDLATAAYYAKDNDTAEKAFQQAIRTDQNYYQAHYNYGIFLFHAKNNFDEALQEWKIALSLNPSTQDTEQLKRLISGLEKEIAMGQSK